jgi:glycerophosphoryl diester phosphodiesterase
MNADNCYLRCGMLSVNKKLPSQLWNYILYQLKTFEDKDFSNLIDKLVDYHRQLMPEKKIKTYKEFEYGIDEILLNYYGKKFFIENNFKMKVVRYRPHILIIVNTIITYLKSYYSKDKTLVQTFYKNVLKEKYKNNIVADSDSFNKLFYLNLNLDSEYEDVKKYNDILKNELKLLEKINLPKVILCFIKNVSKDDYIKVNSFNDYFYSYNTPKYLV